MDKVIFLASSLDDGAGSFDSITGNLAVEDFTMGSIDYSIPGGIDYVVNLSNIGDAIVATGTASATVIGQCARCLEPASEFVESDVEGYFTLFENSDVEGMEDDEYELISESGEIDLADSIRSAVVVEMPPTFLCREDCKGLCPSCGCNLNEEQCDCASKPDEMNPFYALKDLFKDEEAE
ncbi:MAG: YceD family protein [Coriobacteriales bacterium]